MESAIIKSAPAGASDLIKETSVQSFMQDVIQPSLQTPVLLYFTAPWCGPCKQLGPVLEKIVKEAEGKLRLVRVNIDKHPQIAQQFRVQSVPAVYAFVQGQPVDAFMGALPESQLRQFIARLGVEGGESPIEQALELAEAALQAGNTEQALALFQEVKAAEPQHPQALAGIIKTLTAQAKFDEAEAVLKELPDTLAMHEAVSAAKAALMLAREATKDHVDLAELQARLKADPLDHEARFQLAVQNFALGKHEEAIDDLLAIIEKHRQWNEEAARKQLLSFFEILGLTHPLTLKGRRRLSSLIFS